MLEKEDGIEKFDNLIYVGSVECLLIYNKILNNPKQLWNNQQIKNKLVKFEYIIK